MYTDLILHLSANVPPVLHYIRFGHSGQFFVCMSSSIVKTRLHDLYFSEKNVHL